MSGHRVYVVELVDAAAPRDHERFPNLYVGETGKPVLQRYADHLAGHKAGRKIVTRYHRWLRPDLHDGLERMAWELAVVEERRYAERLRDSGYTVYTDGVRLESVPESRLIPFDLHELPKAQLGHLDASILAVLANPLRPLSATQSAHVLWGSRGAQIAAWGLRELPEYGRFAHLRHGEICDRVGRLRELRLLTDFDAGLKSHTLRPLPFS